MDAIQLELNEAVRTASQRPEVRTALADIYTQLQQQIDSRKPLCSASGKCCRFETYGHRLYVTTLELAAFAAQLQNNPDQPWDGTGCPFQQNGLCSVHPIRPFGCRIFFCDPTSTTWQNDQYEHFHARIKSLHAQLDVPYYYVEWRHALRACGLPPEPGRRPGLNRLSLPQLPL